MHRKRESLGVDSDTYTRTLDNKFKCWSARDKKERKHLLKITWNEGVLTALIGDVKKTTGNANQPRLYKKERYKTPRQCIKFQN